jgi:signal transduction histidine kinase
MEEVLLLSRFDAGRMACEPAETDLRGLGARTRDEVLAATEHSCAIDFQFRADTNVALADERLLRHVFTNLLTNAVKYSEPGSTVEFSIEQNGANAICRVRDRGIGIPEGDQGWLFNAFHRGRNVGQRPGTGLGLVIVKRCVELHGGQISVQSKVGEGTTVTVTMALFGTSSPGSNTPPQTP